MLTKIISSGCEHFKRKKQPPLSSLIIVGLLAICSKQIKGISFVPGDITGSFTLLIKRSLIIRKEATIHEYIKFKELAPFSTVPLFNTISPME